MKRICPHCKEKIKEGATKCPHCRSDLRNWFSRHPILTFLLILIILFSALSNYLSQSHTEPSSTTNTNATDITLLPALELAEKTEEGIVADYSTLYTNYSEGHLTPSGKVRITSFDITNANMQIDYNVSTNTPLYIGYSFANNPLTEDTAWQITGMSKPISTPTTNPGVMNRTVYVWEHDPAFAPYLMVQAIYEADGTVGKIAFSKEDLQTAQGTSSLYFVQ